MTMRTTVPRETPEGHRRHRHAGNLPLTRLTVLKKWFERPGRLPVFGLSVARQAVRRKGKMQDGAGALLYETRALLGSAATRESLFQQIDREAAQSLHDRARKFQKKRTAISAFFRSSNRDRCGSSCWTAAWSKRERFAHWVAAAVDILPNS